MADNVQITAGSGTTIATDEVTDGTLGTAQVQYVKIMDGTLNGTTKATVNAMGLKVDASGAAVPVTDNAGSITVDAPVGTPVFARLSDGAAALVGQKAMAASLPVTVASDQTSLQVTPASLTGTTKSTVVTVGTTAAALPATPLANRRTILVQSDSANTANIFLGGSGVTSGTGTTAGIVLKAGESMTLDASTALVYAISTTASQLVRVLEVS